MRILVTGANGFIGSRLCQVLLAGGHNIVGAVRRASQKPEEGVESFVVGEINGLTDWTRLLPQVDAVVHLAAKVHIVHDSPSKFLEEYRTVNTKGTLNLAQRAADAGVRRFVFLSSIKVNGEASEPGHPFTEDDVPLPADPYGVSKWEAEQALFQLSQEAGIEVVVVRPPLVYGPGVKANFRTMMSWIEKGIPLPFGAIHNRRTLIGIDNLADLVSLCVWHPAAANEVFLAGDGEDLSTTDLLRRVAMAFGRPARLLPIPESWLIATARALRKPHIATRLCGTLQADIGKAKSMLGWVPPVGIDEELRCTAKQYLMDLARGG